VPESHLGNVYNVLHKRRGEILEELQPTPAPLFDIKAYLPVAESFGKVSHHLQVCDIFQKSLVTFHL
jgi:translation elongation factor EF-G